MGEERHARIFPPPSLSSPTSGGGAREAGGGGRPFHVSAITAQPAVRASVGTPLAIHLRLLFAPPQLPLARHPARDGEKLPLRFCFQSLLVPLSVGRRCGLEMAPTCPIPVMARRLVLRPRVARTGGAGHPAASARQLAIEKSLLLAFALRVGFI